MTDSKDLHVTWEDYNRLIERLAVMIHDSGWQFDAIICLAACASATRCRGSSTSPLAS
jgi:hypothetical protein